MANDFNDILLTPYSGLNLVDNAHRMKAGELVTATNILCNPDGSYQRIDCYKDILSSTLGAGYALSVYEFERWDGSLEIYFFYDTTFYKLDNVGNTATALKTGLSSNKKMGYASYNDYLYFGNSFDANMMLCPTFSHKIARAAITTAGATDLPTVKTLANALKADMNTHLASTTQHNQADSTNTIGFTDLVGGDTQATTNTACNELKTDFNAHRSQSSVHPTNDSYHLVEAANASDLSTSITLINQIKACYNQHIGEATVALMNIVAPTVAPTTADSGVAGSPNGAYTHVYTFYDTVNGVESTPSPASTSLSVVSKKITVSAMEISTNPNVTHKRIYRTVAYGAARYLVATVTNITASYTDNTADSALSTYNFTAYAGVIPPSNKFLMYNDRMYIAGDLTAPYRMIYSESYSPWFYTTVINYIDYDIMITALARVPQGVLTFEKNKFWLNAGVTPDAFSRILVSPIVGCTNQNGFCYRGDTVIFISKYGLFYTDGGAFDNKQNLMSYNINPELITKNLDDACVTYNAVREEIRVTVASA